MEELQCRALDGCGLDGRDPEAVWATAEGRRKVGNKRVGDRRQTLEVGHFREHFKDRHSRCASIRSSCNKRQKQKLPQKYIFKSVKKN